MTSRSHRRSVFALGALAAFLALALPAASAQSLWFTEYQFNNPKIKGMGPLGQSPTELFTIPSSQWLPLDLTFDPLNGFLYWTDFAGTNELMRARPDGSQLGVVLTGGSLRGPGVDAQGRLYYVDGNTLRRANANGTGVVVLYTAAQTFPLGAPFVDATNGHVYFGADHAIRRVDLDGQNPKVVVSGVAIARAVAVDVAGGYVYWIDTDTISDFVGRARLDGSEFTVLIDQTPGVVQSPGLIQLALDPASNALYFADELFQTAIFRANLDGTNPAPIYTSPSGLAPSGIVLAGGPAPQAVADCNGNGMPDAQDLALGLAQDCNGNGVPDSCEADACPQRVFYVDQGSDPQPSSRTIGCAAPSPGFCSEVFQPFDVTGTGFAVREIGLDGWTANYAFGAGFDATLFPDDGSGQFADESAPIAGANFQFRFDTDGVNWQYRPMEAALLPGRYWLRLTAAEPLYHGAANVGTSGLPSKSRSGSGSIVNGPPIALRVVAGDVAATPPVLSLTAGGVQNVVIDAGPAFANHQYWLLGSVTGTTPGLPLNPELVLPLNFDAYTFFLLQAPNAPPLLNATSILDADGRAAAFFFVPSNSPTLFAGLTFHHAYVVIGTGGVPVAVSGATQVTLAP